MKKWKCTVCGYVHAGDEPPEVCPVCGADKTKFVLLKPEEVEAAETAFKNRFQKKAPAPKAPAAAGAEAIPTASAPNFVSRLYAFLISQLVKNHGHPMTVHVPNGVLPAAVLFLTLAIVLELVNFLEPTAGALAKASFFNLIFVVITMPAVLFTGYVDWKANLKGVMTRVIMTKMICGVAVLTVGIVLIVWRLVAGEAVVLAGASRWAYLLVHLLMLSFAAYAGYLGGRLVFND